MLWVTYQSLIKELGINLNNSAKVAFARDTRASGNRLTAALVAGLDASGCEHTDFRLMTTPQLHYVTRCLNTKGSPMEYGEPTEDGYYRKLAEAFTTAMKERKHDGSLVVDCANGVGGPKLSALLKYLPPASEGGLGIKIVNDNVLDPDRLNYQVNESPNSNGRNH